jgi:hypothetical protein
VSEAAATVTVPWSDGSSGTLLGRLGDRGGAGRCRRTADPGRRTTSESIRNAGGAFTSRMAAPAETLDVRADIACASVFYICTWAVTTTRSGIDFFLDQSAQTRDFKDHALASDALAVESQIPNLTRKANKRDSNFRCCASPALNSPNVCCCFTLASGLDRLSVFIMSSPTASNQDCTTVRLVTIIMISDISILLCM